MGASNARSSGYQQAGNTLMDTWAISQMKSQANKDQFGGNQNGYNDPNFGGYDFGGN